MTKGLEIVFAPIAALWIEHVISNLHFLAIGYVAYLFYQASFGWFSIFSYVATGILMWQLEKLEGIKAIKQLRPDYPYKDSSLKPSILYLLGINKHLEEYPFMDVEWPTETGTEI